MSDKLTACSSKKGLKSNFNKNNPECRMYHGSCYACVMNWINWKSKDYHVDTLGIKNWKWVKILLALIIFLQHDCW